VEETPKKCRDMIESARRLLEEPKFSQQFGAEEKNRLVRLDLVVTWSTNRAELRCIFRKN